MNYKYSILLLFIGIIFFMSCVKNMDEELIPSYVKVDQIQMVTTSSQGSSSSNISDAWFFVNGADRGAYPLPATIPTIGEGEVTLKFAPGIKLNGVSNTRVPYPLVEPAEIEVELIKDSVLDLTVKCNYYSTTSFALIEDFEDINVSFETYGSFNTATWRSTSRNSDPDDYIFEGSHSGLGLMENDTAELLIVTKQIFEDLPKSGNPVFVELDFKTNTYVDMKMSGIYGEADLKRIVVLNPTEDEWKKIYINLTNIISYDTEGEAYRIWFNTTSNTAIDEDSYFLMDNFKLVYRDTSK